MTYYTVADPFGKRATVLAVGADSAKTLARHDLGLHPLWPVTVLKRPDPPGVRTKARMRVSGQMAEAQAIAMVE